MRTSGDVDHYRIYSQELFSPVLYEVVLTAIRLQVNNISIYLGVLDCRVWTTHVLALHVDFRDTLHNDKRMVISGTCRDMRS